MADHFLKTAANESGTVTGNGDLVVLLLRELVTTVHLPMITEGAVVKSTSDSRFKTIAFSVVVVVLVLLLAKLEAHFLKMEEKALSGVTRANGGSVLPLSRAEVVVQLNGFHSAEAAVVVELIE